MLECVSLNKSGTDLCEARRGDLIGREGLGGRGLMLPRVVAKRETDTASCPEIRRRGSRGLPVDSHLGADLAYNSESRPNCTAW